MAGRMEKGAKRKNVSPQQAPVCVIGGGRRKGDSVDILKGVMRGVGRIVRISSILAMVAIIGLFLLIFADIVLRATVSVSLEGSIEISEYLLIALGFLGLGQAQLMGGHINVDVLFLKFSPRWRHVIQIAILVGLAVFFIIMAKQIGVETYVSWVEKIDRPGTTLLIPTWPRNLVAFIGCVLLIFAFLAQILQNILRLMGRSHNGS